MTNIRLNDEAVGVIIANMTDFTTDKDRADLATAATMVKEGHALRTRVRTRIRQRRYKHRMKTMGLQVFSTPEGER